MDLKGNTVAISAARIETVSPSAGSSPFVERMEIARSRIEERFLEGGAALLSILDVLNKLIGSLDQVTGSLDEQTAKATMDELERTVSGLSGLSVIETGRQARFQEISSAERNLRPQVDDMQETLRYLRTFAVTAKITGAGVEDFAGFAEEILQRIQDGTRQVNEFADKLQQLGSGLRPIQAKGEKIIQSYKETIPRIIAGLSSGGAEIGSHRRMLMQRADSVRIIAKGIQGKLASTLSAMQIGDITRQRIEHCQSSLAILDEFLASPEAKGLDAVQRDSLSQVIANLVSKQLNQSIDDFDRDTRKIVATVASFRSDLMEIEALRRAMTENDGDGGSDNAIRQLENGVGAARKAVREIEAVAHEATDLSRSTGQTVNDLVKGIGVVQLVRTDIHYMALNTNLRCSKIGEEGKAINVVTSELRNFAAHLDETADKILLELQSLEAAAQKLSLVEEVKDEHSLDQRLETAMANIRAAGDRMDAEMTALGEQSQTAVTQMDASLARLDFQAELGDVLRACADDIGVKGHVREAAGLDQALADIGGRIARLYTMVSERELHARLLGTAAPIEAPVVASVMSDDDIDDALF
ncbi:hypothetical protein E2F50_15585 [Rhizobium deserti]|uniref:Methyl-accepting transducer domain-containing protein n=1 Tax=Rhizobium deserti TaxID=2547961 RepID=A0A4R5UI46_9HYPH|nr:methyl-accepting chemotaxis protein [Rhizobium deserti]TDK35643.1 hypothetical protein E2F50_15585 [Rhizobium deserti]